ncbi:MAG: hypothetical protein WC496_02650 [Phycisphaerae bacterium]|jgi:DNA-directed RNA polymerase specialized sigma24 family protein
MKTLENSNLTIADLFLRHPAITDSRQEIETFIDKQIDIRISKLKKVMEIKNLSPGDVRQEFVLAIIEAMPNFNAGVSTWQTYVSKVCNNRYCNFRREYRIKLKCIGNMVSLDTIENDESGIVPTYEVDFETEHDVSIVLEKMPEHLREIAELLKSNSPAKTASLLGISRATISRSVKQIRAFFLASGFKKIACL